MNPALVAAMEAALRNMRGRPDFDVEVGDAQMEPGPEIEVGDAVLEREPAVQVTVGAGAPQGFLSPDAGAAEIAGSKRDADFDKAGYVARHPTQGLYPRPRR